MARSTAALWVGRLTALVVVVVAGCGSAPPPRATNHPTDQDVSVRSSASASRSDLATGGGRGADSPFDGARSIRCTLSHEHLSVALDRPDDAAPLVGAANDGYHNAPNLRCRNAAGELRCAGQWEVGTAANLVVSQGADDTFIGRIARPTGETAVMECLIRVPSE